MPEFQWVNTVLGNLKSSLSGSYHGFNFYKCATRYLGAFAYRFNRRFDLSSNSIPPLAVARRNGVGNVDSFHGLHGTPTACGLYVPKVSSLEL